MPRKRRGNQAAVIDGLSLTAVQVMDLIQVTSKKQAGIDIFFQENIKISINTNYTYGNLEKSGGNIHTLEKYEFCCGDKCMP